MNADRCGCGCSYERITIEFELLAVTQVWKSRTWSDLSRFYYRHYVISHGVNAGEEVSYFVLVFINVLFGNFFSFDSSEVQVYIAISIWQMLSDNSRNYYIYNSLSRR